MSQEVIEAIKTEIENNKVVLFMKGTKAAPQCGFSAATSQILQEAGCEYKVVDVLANPEIRTTLPEYSQWPTFPQLFIGGKLIGGCDIVHELSDSGELEKILNQA